jgi:hypothetical protein
MMVSQVSNDLPRIVTGKLPSSDTITIWLKATASAKGVPSVHTWGEDGSLVKYFRKWANMVKAKKDLPAPVFAVFRPQCTPDDCSKARELGKPILRHRCDDAVRTVTALVFDHDHCKEIEPQPWEPVVEWLKNVGLAAIIYESPRHNLPGSDGSIGPRWRLIIPLSNGDKPEIWKKHYNLLRQYFEAQLGVVFDDKCSNPSRIFYPPCRLTEEVPPRQVIWVEGEALDMDSTVILLNKAARTAAPSMPPPPPRPTATVDASRVRDLDSQDRDSFERWCQGAFRGAVQEVSSASPGTRNETLNTQAFALFARFSSNALLDEGAIISSLLGAAKTAGLSDNEAKKTLESALRGAKAKPVTIYDLLADWKRTRRVIPFRRPAAKPSPAPAYDPETGEVDPEGAPGGSDPDAAPGAPPGPVDAPAGAEGGEGSDADPDPSEGSPEGQDGPSPVGFRDFQRLVNEVPGVDERFAVPPKFYVGTTISAAGVKGEPYLAKLVVKKSPDGDEETIEVKIAHCAMWVESKLANPGPEGTLLDIHAIADGQEVSLVLPASMIHDARKLAMALEGGGIRLCPDKTTAFDIAKYLSAFIHLNRFWIPRRRAQVRMGWDDEKKSFLYGNESIGDDTLVLYTGAYSGTDRASAALRVEGSIEVWRAAAEDFLRASPAGALALAAAAASPCLRVFGWPPVGLVYGGLGGTGKTAVLTLAGSAFGATGDPSSRQAAGVVGNGIATLNALVGQFLPMADLPHAADEVRINVNDARARGDTEAALHALIDGQGRSRLRRDSRGTVATECSPGCALLGTETDPSEFLRKGGAMRRYLCPRPPYGDQLGRFREFLAKNYGHVGRALVQALVMATPARRAELAEIRVKHMEALRAELTPDQDNESVRTWTEQIAVCLATVEVVHELCPGMWPDAAVWFVSIRKAWEGILADSSAQGEGDPVVIAYEKTVNWISAKRAHLRPSSRRMRELGSGETGQRRLAAVREPLIGQVREANQEDMESEELEVVDILQDALIDYLSSLGYSMRTMGERWAEKGWLIFGKDINRVSARIGGVKCHVFRVKLPDVPSEEG